MKSKFFATLRPLEKSQQIMTSFDFYRENFTEYHRNFDPLGLDKVIIFIRVVRTSVPHLTKYHKQISSVTIGIAISGTGV